MKAIRETIGNTTILIQALDDDLEIVGEAQGGRATRPTGIKVDVREVYAKTKAVIKDIAEDIGAELRNIHAPARPKQVEMEFNVGISAQYGPVWILSGGGEYGLKIKMTWDLSGDGQTS